MNDYIKVVLDLDPRKCCINNEWKFHYKGKLKNATGPKVSFYTDTLIMAMSVFQKDEIEAYVITYRRDR